MNNEFYDVVEMLLDEITEEYFNFKDKDEHLNPKGCENCKGYFGYSPEEGYLYECCDCQKYYSGRKERLTELRAYMEVLTEILNNKEE